MKKQQAYTLIAVGVVIGLILAVCGFSMCARPIPVTPAPTYTPLVTYTPAPTYTPVPTYTPMPTITSGPTITPSPTLMPTNTAKPTVRTNPVQVLARWPQGTVGRFKVEASKSEPMCMKRENPYTWRAFINADVSRGDQVPVDFYAKMGIGDDEVVFKVTSTGAAEFEFTIDDGEAGFKEVQVTAVINGQVASNGPLKLMVSAPSFETCPKK